MLVYFDSRVLVLTVKGWSYDGCLARKRVQPRNRMRENRTSGSVQGAPGNRRSYCERSMQKKKDLIQSFLRLKDTKYILEAVSV